MPRHVAVDPISAAAVRAYIDGQIPGGRAKLQVPAADRAIPVSPAPQAYPGRFDTTDAEDGNTHNTYLNDRLESSINPVGALTAYSYYNGETGGGVGDLKTVTVTEWDPVLNENVTLSKTTYTYDANSNVQTERQERKTGTATGSPVQALITTYSYDAQNRVILTRVQADPPDAQVDSTSGMSYNSIGKVETSTDRLGRVTRYNYDARGNLVQTEYPGSDVDPAVPVTIARTVYDAAGRACYIQEQHEKPATGNASTALSQSSPPVPIRPQERMRGRTPVPGRWAVPM